MFSETSVYWNALIGNKDKRIRIPMYNYWWKQRTLYTLKPDFCFQFKLKIGCKKLPLRLNFFRLGNALKNVRRAWILANVDKKRKHFQLNGNACQTAASPSFVLWISLGEKTFAYLLFHWWKHEEAVKVLTILVYIRHDVAKGRSHYSLGFALHLFSPLRVHCTAFTSNWRFLISGCDFENAIKLRPMTVNLLSRTGE